MIEPSHAELSIANQCALLGLPRSTYYYAPKGETPLNLRLMRHIDEQYLRTPYYGAPKMTEHLRRLGLRVNHKRVERLMKLMGLRAATPKRCLSQPDSTHRIYPYLLRDLVVKRPNQVWCTDITYICPKYHRVKRSVIGFCKFGCTNPKLGELLEIGKQIQDRMVTLTSMEGECTELLGMWFRKDQTNFESISQAMSLAQQILSLVGTTPPDMLTAIATQGAVVPVRPGILSGACGSATGQETPA